MQRGVILVAFVRPFRLLSALLLKARIVNQVCSSTTKMAMPGFYC